MSAGQMSAGQTSAGQTSDDASVGGAFELGGAAQAGTAPTPTCPTCDDPTPHCDEAVGECRTCLTSEHCGETGLICKVEACAGAGACVSPFAGNWTGIWECESCDFVRGLSFAVDADGTLSGLQLNYRFSDNQCGDTGWVEATADPMTLAADGAFEVSFRGCNEVSFCFSGKLTGAIDGDAATGDFRVTGANGIAPVCFIGVGSSPTSWSAARDCSIVPSDGASATRFCDGDTPVGEEPAPGCAP